MNEHHPTRDEAPPLVHYATMLPVSREERLGFVVRAVLAVAGASVGLFVLWTVREALLLVFMSVVLAAVLLAAVAPVRRYAHLSHRWSLTVVGVVLFVVIAALAWLVGVPARVPGEQR